VIGDRDVARSPHMSPVKRFLQRLGSWTVGKASGVHVTDATSGFRAFSRDAAMQINVFNPFTYTLETLIQSGNRNLGVQSVVIATNKPTRPSRLYRGIGSYLRKSATTIFRTYTVYRPLKTFFFIGTLLLLAGIAIGARFLWYFFGGDRGGHVQSLILAAVLLIAGFQTLLIGLVADLISVNRRLSEEMLIRLRRLEMPAPAARKPAARTEQRPPRRERPAAAAAAAPIPAAPPDTKWVWLLDEEKLQDRIAGDESPAPPAEEPEPEGPRRRRRRRGGARQRTELPGNRGKHLAGNEPES
jgi:hypothetical protein